MRKPFLMFAWASLGAISWPASAAQTASDLASPATIAARSVVQAINGAEAERVALVQGAFTAKALAAESAESRLKWLDKLASESSGLTMISSAPQGDRMVEAIIKSRRGGRFGKLVLFTSSKEPGKISDLFLLPARDPAKVARQAWPTGRLAPAAISAAIARRTAALAADDEFSGVVLVAKGGKVITRLAFGFADQEWKVPNRADTRFHIASIGKMFTAVAVLKLAGQGKLRLDDRLAKWVPEYSHAEAAQITLRQLLTHSPALASGTIARSATKPAGPKRRER